MTTFAADDQTFRIVAFVAGAPAGVVGGKGLEFSDRAEAETWILHYSQGRDYRALTSSEICLYQHGLVTAEELCR